MPYSRATTEPSTRSHQPADFHYQPARGEKKRRPRRVGAGAHQNLAGGQLRSIGIEDHAHRAFHHTGRDRAAHDDVFVRARRRSAPRKSSAHRSAAGAGSACGVFRARRRPAARPNGGHNPRVRAFQPTVICALVALVGFMPLLGGYAGLRPPPIAQPTPPYVLPMPSDQVRKTGIKHIIGEYLKVSLFLLR